MTVYGCVRGADGTPRPVEAEGPDYETARDALYAIPGDGEILLSIAVWPV